MNGKNYMVMVWVDDKTDWRAIRYSSLEEAVKYLNGYFNTPEDVFNRVMLRGEVEIDLSGIAQISVRRNPENEWWKQFFPLKSGTDFVGYIQREDIFVDVQNAKNHDGNKSFTIIDA